MLLTCKRTLSTINTKCLTQKYQNFAYFLEDCNCVRNSEEDILIWNHVKQFENDNDNNDYYHIKDWFMAQENMKKIAAPTSGQKGCFDIIPHLTAKPIWDKKKFDFVQELENNYNIIKDELLNLKNENKTNGFQQYKNSNDLGATDIGHWNVFYFILHHLEFAENIAKFPKTMDIINNINEPTLFKHSLISCLSPNSHIIGHNGPTNKKLRVYFPILLEENSNILRIDQETITLKEGECIIFDDSFNHEAWNKSKIKSRFVLIFDIYHPDLTQNEIDFLSKIQEIYEKNLLKQAKIAINENNDNNINNPYINILNTMNNDINIPFQQIYSGIL